MFKAKIKNKSIFLTKDRQSTIIKVENTLKDTNFTFYGIFGLLSANRCDYMIFIKDANLISEIKSKKVFEIKDVEIIQTRGINNQKQMTMIQNFFKLPGIYFSEYPLYKSLSYKREDTAKKFMFNYLPYKNLIRYNRNLHEYSIKCIQGYCEQIKYLDNSLLLISRRAWKRSGCRYFSRGADNEGNVSNFVETELILFFKDDYLSFLQVRGSIPFKWCHRLSYKYAPEIKLTEDLSLFNKSHDLLVNMYDHIFYLNLIKDTGYEGDICKLFSMALEKQDHFHIDFHTSGIPRNKENWLYFNAEISEIVQKCGYGTKSKKQNGIIRTNCIDCLDRTNLSQYFIADIFLKDRLKKAEYDEISDDLKMLWYKNGNILSVQYAGTPAIKADYILNKGYSVSGMLRDFYNSVYRYFFNRFCQGDLQNIYDMISGSYNSKIRKINQKHQLRVSVLILFLLGFIMPCYYIEDKKVSILLLMILVMALSVYSFDYMLNLPTYTDN